MKFILCCVTSDPSDNRTEKCIRFPYREKPDCSGLFPEESCRSCHMDEQFVYMCTFKWKGENFSKTSDK